MKIRRIAVTLFERLKKDIIDYKWAIIGIVMYIVFMKLIFDEFCPLVIFAGIPCPGCGMSRSLYLFCIGEFADSFRYHPFMLPCLWIGCVFCCKRYIKGETTHMLKKYVIGIACILIVYYIYRMYTMFPGDKPMNYNGSNMIAQLFRILKK